MSLPFLQPYFGLSNSLQTAQASAGGGGVGGWKELGRISGNGTTTNMIVSSLPNKRYLQFLTYTVPNTGNGTANVRMGSGSTDTGTNYARRLSGNGAADGTAASQNEIRFDSNLLNSATPRFGVGYVANFATKEKLLYGWSVDQKTAGAGTDPDRGEIAGKWANTSNALDTFTINNAQGTNWATTSETVVLGWDPADTHTTNFWTELASVDLSGGAASYIDSGTITAKKYLWYQIYSSQTIDSDFIVTFNADATSKYNRRYSYNGATDVYSDINLTGYPHTSNAANTPSFFNAFVVNNLANEKLIIAHDVMRTTAGAGIAPNRLEGVGKWANTTAQITSMRVTSGSGNLNTNTYLRIWGSD